MKLSDDVLTLKGIGPKKAKILNDHNLHTLEDLLYFFPRSYEDRRRVCPVKDLVSGQKALISGRVLRKNYRGNRYSRAPLQIKVADETGVVDVVFFNGFYVDKAINTNGYYTFYGKVSENLGSLQMVNPEFVKAGSSGDVRGVLPVYPNMEGFSQNELRKIQMNLKPLYSQVREWLPEEIVTGCKLAEPAYAIEHIHFPTKGQQVLEGKYRLVFEDLLALETGLTYIKQGNSAVADGIVIDTEAHDEFLKTLPFELTEGQKEAWQDIREDLEGPGTMNRLVQGDVGSGKTVIAQLAMFSAARAGYQSAIMAPTEILAKQHYESFKSVFEPLGIKVGLLCSSMKAAEKKAVFEGLERGEISVVTGTHALLSDNVVFDNLGLVVTDEQHRFGVNQRKTLTSKGNRPNTLVMTATPIPRTLAVVLYGDLDISQIRTKPVGRKEIRTSAVSRQQRKKAYRLVEDEMRKGRQVYVVAPLIEPSEKLEVLSAQELYEKLTERFEGFRVGLVHGAMKQEEKDSIMEAFVAGEIDLLVSTVVIEVGINVPNATVMVVENAERFGLSQLHQLRGRVGRGGEQSYCLLMSDSKNPVSQRRLEILAESSDGFEIAEEDLKLRGPGELLGTRQHGLPEIRLGVLLKHTDALEAARKVAVKVIEEDERLETEKYAGLKDRVKKMFGDDIKLEL